MYAVHAARFAHRFRKYNKSYKPLFDRFVDSIGLGRWGKYHQLSDVPRDLVHTGIGAGSVGVAMLGMKRQRGSYAKRKRSAARKYSVSKRRKGMPRQALPYRMAATRRSRVKSAQPGMVRQVLRKKTALRKKRVAVKPKLNVAYDVLRHQGIRAELPNDDPDDAVYNYPGYYPLGKQDPALSANTLLPVYVMNLTGMQNTATPVELWRVGLNDTGVPIFNNNFCQDTGSVNQTSRWYPEDQRHDAPGASKYGQVAWWDVRMKLYGARKQAVTYDIMLVKFNRDYLDPISGSSNASEDTLKRDFWQNLSRQYTINSILPGTTDWRRYIKVVKSQRVEIPAATNQELDRNPVSIDLKWFVRDGKVREYVETTSNFASDVAALSTNWVSKALTTVSNNPRARDRLYLIVCATDMTPPSATEDQDDNASFDMLIRRKMFKYAI